MGGLTIRSVLFLIAIVLSAACGRPGSGSRTQVYNGTPQTGLSAVVQVNTILLDETMGTCTGTFISNSVLVTAAHCLKGATSVVAMVEGTPRSATGFAIHPHWVDDGAHRAWDVGIVTFPGGTSSVSSQICMSLPPLNEEVILAGFGEFLPGQPLDGSLRMGLNRIHDVQNNVIIVRGNIYQGQALTGPGDSGGSLISDFCVRGVLSGGIHDPETGAGISLFASLGNPLLRDFINLYHPIRFGTVPLGGGLCLASAHNQPAANVWYCDQAGEGMLWHYNPDLGWLINDRYPDTCLQTDGTTLAKGNCDQYVPYGSGQLRSIRTGLCLTAGRNAGDRNSVQVCR